MPAVHDPAALTVNLPAVSSRGAPIAVVVGEKALGFGETSFRIVGDLRLDGRIERLDREGFRIAARLGGALRLECVRCLGPVGFPLLETLDLVYLPRTEGGSPAREGGERALDASDMNVSFYDGDSLDLGGAVREQLHLALPVKPLCSPDCLGLCPSCGADRNAKIRCACADDAPAGRGAMGGLLELLDSRQRPG